MLVVDASVLAPALGDDGLDGVQARSHLAGQEIAAPELIDLEVASVLRRLVRAGHLPESRASRALTDLGELPLRRLPHRVLLSRCWELRDNLTPYDASYVAAAELLGATLLTADLRLSGAPGLRCAVEVLVSPARGAGD